MSGRRAKKKTVKKKTVKKKTAKKATGTTKARAKKAQTKTRKRAAKTRPSGPSKLKRLQPVLEEDIKQVLARRRRRLRGLPHTPRLKLLEVEVDGYTYVLNRIRPLPADTLTNRQRQVVRLVTQGLSNREIACKLRRSPATVAAHLRRIFQTLGVKSRTALVKHALTY